MNNTDRATVLKYEGNEWARIWKEKLIEHKFDIEQALLFGTQATTSGVLGLEISCRVEFFGCCCFIKFTSF